MGALFCNIAIMVINVYVTGSGTGVPPAAVNEMPQRQRAWRIPVFEMAELACGNPNHRHVIW